MTADDRTTFDTAVLLVGQPDAIDAFAKEIGLPADSIVALLQIYATVNDTSLTMAKAPTTLQ